MKSLILLSLLLHVLFLLSIFYIYFRSIITPGLSPLNDLDNPPAKRLVLIVADGLRAESFFEHNLNRTKYLKHILLTRGICGVSHTHVPTESRPGHVALIAGVYEDPSSIFKGWKENPVTFDSVFNRSEKTFAWGSPDILPMFSKGATPDKVIIDSYKSEDEVFSISAHSYLLDQWVFEKVKTFLNREKFMKEIKKKRKVIFFLHLLGMDTSGHIHKPHSIRYTENLKFVDRGISEVVKLFENVFDDNETAFIFTSDHGMTNRGAHGSGSRHETETPFLAWGAGVNFWSPASENFVTRNFLTIDGQKIPRYDIEQADAAPLMSTLLGIPVPTNNFGKLPYMYPNVSNVYLANAFANNAYQLHAIYQSFHKNSRERTFDFSFNPNEKIIEDEVTFLDEQIRLSFTLKDYDDIIVKSNKFITLLLNGIDFYQMYYKNELLLAVTISIVGWIALLYLYIMTSEMTLRIEEKYLKIGSFLIIVIATYNFCQKVPIQAIGYFLLPIIIWMIVLSNNRRKALQSFMTNKHHILTALMCIIAAEFLVFSFFQRKILSLLLLGYSGIVTTYAIRKNLQPKLKVFKYFSSAVCLGIFPLLKVVEKDTKNLFLLALGTVFWIFRSMDYVYLKRYDRTSVVQTVLLFCGGLFVLFLVFHLEAGNDLEDYQRIISWIVLISPFVTFWGSVNMEIRLKAIGNGLCLPFILMSLSYEPLFLISFYSHIMSWVEMELVLFRRSKQLKDFKFEHLKDNRRREIDINDVRCVLVFMLYLMISFFGTGNMATISSFDPNWVRCLVTTFSPFLMTALIIFKLSIPINLLSCCYRALHIALRADARKMFIMMLVICDIMCLNFLYLVKNKGSWLEIGTSLSHFIIMETAVLVLILFYGLSQFFTTLKIFPSQTFKID
ncbi:CLUMA_CG004809, isoform A [Clunio marinus]|uniref:GPI ethanolamine phosphate transferase 1 n=1 Tax=Clunio marinus TaxID=568069 RepID=A0A1J1HYA9_9DIPT|nr:CLUMA_CG004809, isoform A [Clunio marinus]